jgi:hypothetical protein
MIKSNSFPPEEERTAVVITASLQLPHAHRQQTPRRRMPVGVPVFSVLDLQVYLQIYFDELDLPLLAPRAQHRYRLLQKDAPFVLEVLQCGAQI